MNWCSYYHVTHFVKMSEVANYASYRRKSTCFKTTATLPNHAVIVQPPGSSCFLPCCTDMVPLSIICRYTSPAIKISDALTILIMNWTHTTRLISGAVFQPSLFILAVSVHFDIEIKSMPVYIFYGYENLQRITMWMKVLHTVHPPSVHLPLPLSTMHAILFSKLEAELALRWTYKCNKKQFVTRLVDFSVNERWTLDSSRVVYFLSWGRYIGPP